MTHSAFCEPEMVVLGFTLESNHDFSAAGIRTSYIHFATKKCKCRSASHISALIVKTSFSEMHDRAKLGRNGLYFQGTHSFGNFIFFLPEWPDSFAFILLSF